MRVPFLFFLALPLLQSCADPGADDVQRKYNARVRQIGLVPVYPPREEFQVGDIYVVSWRPSDPDVSSRFFVGSLDFLVAEAQSQLNRRIVFKKTEQSADKSTSARTQDDLFNGRIIRRSAATGENSTLPIAAFPSVTADAGFSLNGASQGPLSALGIFAGGRTSVTLDFKDVRSYSVPQAEVAGQVKAALESPALAAPECQALSLLAGAVADADARSGSSPSGRRTAFSVITRVYLARSISYTYRNAKLLALAQKSLPQPGGATPTSAFNGSTVILNAPAGSTDTTAAELADVINKLNAQTAAGSGNGVQTAAFSAFGLTIDRTFERPVSVGYESLMIDPANIDPCSRVAAAPGIKPSGPNSPPSIISPAAASDVLPSTASGPSR